MSSIIIRTYVRRVYHSTSALGQGKVQLILFSKKNCGLCDNFKNGLRPLLAKDDLDSKVNYSEIDIEDPNNKEWWDKYCFDVPVLHIEGSNKQSICKVFHRLNEKEVVNKVKQLL